MCCTRYIDHHLYELRWHHPDDHIANFCSITIGIGIDILTGDSVSDISCITEDDEVVFRLRSRELIFFVTRCIDILVLGIRETYRESLLCESFLDS